MPAASEIVTFTDADGDEFPIRVEGTWSQSERPQLLKLARRRLDEFIARGELKPTEPVIATVDRPSS